MEKKRSISSEQKESDDSIWDCGSPLYDSYELASFGHVLERHTMALPYPCCSSTRFRIISNNPKAEGRFEEEMANLHGVGIFRKVVRWTLIWKMRIRRDRNEKEKKIWSGFYRLCKRVSLCKQEAVELKKI